jgi:hypothetical protein
MTGRRYENEDEPWVGELWMEGITPRTGTTDCKYCKERPFQWPMYPYCSERCKYLGELFDRVKTDPH